MNPYALFTLRAVADATGLDLRRIRSWADAGSLRVIQPARGAERLVAYDEIVRLEAGGLRVNWHALADAADVVSDVPHDLP